jgi:hypothetical protein
MRLDEILPEDIISMNSYDDMGDEVFSLFQVSPEGVPYSTVTDKVFREKRIIFCKTDFIYHLFNILQQCPNLEHTLITHHSDYPITNEMFSKKPQCIKNWFAQNAEFSNRSLFSIPIGIQPPKNGSKNLKYLKENVLALRDNKKDFKIYCAWGDTNKERNDIISKLEHSKMEYTKKIVEFEDYLFNISTHKFVISPPGNGLDCHRTWESLYLGSIPIVKKNRIYDDFDGLPILQVEDWSEINHHLLIDFSERSFDYQKLSQGYWKSRIKNIK